MRSTTSMFGLRRSGVASRPVRLLATVLLLLVASPFTEPFSICAPSVLWSAPHAHGQARPSQPVALDAATHSDIGYPPLSLTDDQLKDAKDVAVPSEIRLSGQSLVFRVVAPARESQMPVAPCRALVLRI